MEKTIMIGQKAVPFKVTGGFLIRYKEMTGRDPIKDVFSLQRLEGKDLKEIDVTSDDMEMLYRILWIMAKTADSEVSDSMLDWLDTFETFPIGNVMTELIPLIVESFSGTVVDQSSAKKKTIKK